MTTKPLNDQTNKPPNYQTTEPIRCTALTASGSPCKAWAIRGSDPPLCAPHSGLVGAPIGNSNAVTHGYYRKRIQPEELENLYDSAANLDLAQEAILLRVLLHRLAGYLNDPDLPLDEIKTISPLLISAIRALGYLQKQLPIRGAFDLDAALNQLGEEWGWEL